MRFGHGGLVGLDFQPEAGVESWLDHRDAGRCSGEGVIAYLSYLLRLNVAHNYINGLRKFSNDPAWVAAMARKERHLAALVSGGAPTGELARARRARMRGADWHVERSVLDPRLLGVMRDELMHQNSYHDPAIPGWAYRGRVDAAPYSTLFMDAPALFASDTFLAICANPAIMGFCRDVLGPRAALSWAWAWITNSGYLETPRWKWHRNNAEPFNALLVLIPLDAVTTLDHGPMMVIPGSSSLDDCIEPRLYAEDELVDLQARLPADMVPVEVGDAGFINPFALHRMMPPHRRQRMLMLLVSIGPSHRSPAICRRRLADLPDNLRETVAANRRFFHRLVR